MTAPRRPRAVSYVFTPHAGAMYGGERSLALVASRVRTHELTVIANRDDALARALRAAGVAVRALPAGDPFTGFRAAPARERARRVIDWARHNRRLAAVLREIDPDVVHANDLREVVMAAPALLVLRRPLVTHVRARMRMRWFHQAVLAASTRTISISHGLLRDHLDLLHPLLRERVRRRAVVVRNGVDLEAAERHARGADRDAIRARCGIAADEVLVLVVGCLEPEKGQLELVERALPRAAARVPGLRVLMVGGERRGRAPEVDSGAHRRAVVGAVRAAGLQERVAIDGFRADIADLYVAADVVAQPSRSEGLGRAAIEAAAFGRPVVAFDLPGIDETVVDGETGRLVAPGDHAGFADALVALCADASLRRRLGEGGRRLARDRFDPAAAAARMEAVLLAARRARRDRRAGGPGPRALPEPGDRRPAGVR